MRLILLFAIISSINFAMQTCDKKTAITNKPEVAKTNTNASTVKNTSPVQNTSAVETHAEDNAPRISLEGAKKAFDDGSAIFIDTRSADSYKLEHIKGAINITSNDFEVRYKEIPTGKKIIAYCS